MRIKAKLKSFEEIASVSVPTLFMDGDTYVIALENIAYKNFNKKEGKYMYLPSMMGGLHDKDIIVETGCYEDCFLYRNGESVVKLGRWMLNLLEKVKD